MSDSGGVDVCMYDGCVCDFGGQVPWRSSPPTPSCRSGPSSPYLYVYMIIGEPSVRTLSTHDDWRSVCIHTMIGEPSAYRHEA